MGAEWTDLKGEIQGVRGNRSGDGARVVGRRRGRPGWRGEEIDDVGEEEEEG